MSKKDLADFISFLEEKGCTPQEISISLSVVKVGETMTRAIVEFSSRYESKEIDGFPESSLEVLEEFYGEKRLRQMTVKTLAAKVYALQRTITDQPDEEEINYAIDYYLG